MRKNEKIMIKNHRMIKNDRISKEFINNEYIITNGALELGSNEKE